MLGDEIVALKLFDKLNIGHQKYRLFNLIFLDFFLGVYHHKQSVISTSSQTPIRQPQPTDYQPIAKSHTNLPPGAYPVFPPGSGDLFFQILYYLNVYFLFHTVWISSSLYVPILLDSYIHFQRKLEIPASMHSLGNWIFNTNEKSISIYQNENILIFERKNLLKIWKEISFF